MSTQCYAMVRGSGLRVTGLNKFGGLPSVIPFATSKSVTSITINEITESVSNELLRSDDDDPRILLMKNTEPVRYSVDINFIRCDPGILNLVSGLPTVTNAAGDIVGFDANTRAPSATFALEVWSRIAGQKCAAGQRKYGYTLFPYLKGGILDGFTFSGGLVSFRLQGAKTQRGSRWGDGPYDLEGVGQRLTSPVTPRTNWRSLMLATTPPAQADGVFTFTEPVTDGGSASVTSADVVDGQTVTTSADVLEGGRAA